MMEPEGNNTNLSFVSRKWLPLWVALAGFLLYANTIGNDYALDDGAVISFNPYVQQGISGIPGIFTTDLWHFENADLGYYRPLPLATFAMEHQLFQNNAHISHLVNVLLYALTGLLLCLLLFRVFSNSGVVFSFLVALLFIAHPVHTEVVANIKSRDELLSFLNLLLAALLLLRGIGKSITWKWLLPSCFFFYLALLSKETAIVGVLLIPLLAYFTGSLNSKQIIKITIPFILLVLIFQLQKYMVLGTLTGAANHDIVSFPYADGGAQWPTAFLHLAWYIKLIFIPYPLSYNYAYNQIPSAAWNSPGAISGILLTGLLLYFSIKNLNKKSPLALGVCIFSVLLIPAIAFTILKGGILAERFLYAPSLGFSIVITWLILKAQDRIAKSSGVGFKGPTLLLTGAIFLCYSFTTISRNGDWKNDMSITSHDSQISTNSCQVHLHYGKNLVDAGVAEKEAAKKRVYFREGTGQLREAININPHYARAYFKLAYAFQALEENDDSSLYYYQRAIDEAPGYALAYNNLGTLYAKLGRLQLATRYLKKALEINPQLGGTAQLLQKIQNNDVPVSSAEKSNDSTSMFKSYSNLGVKYAQEKNFTDAQKYLLLAIKLNPASAEARVNLAVCYGMMNEYDKSLLALNDALKIDPVNKSALKNMVALYHITGNKAKEDEYRVRLKKAETPPGP